MLIRNIEAYMKNFKLQCSMQFWYKMLALFDATVLEFFSL